MSLFHGYSMRAVMGMVFMQFNYVNVPTYTYTRSVKTRTKKSN